MEGIVVTLGERSYPVTVTSGSSNKPASFLPPKSGEQVMLVTNETLAPLYLGKIRGAFEQAGVNVDSVILPDGEQYKSLAILDTVFTALLQKPYGRDTTLMALGGGVVGDLAGFAAASYQHDICFVQVPTTLLSQADSSVGGKAAVNHPLGENIIGTFYRPALVVVDLDCLKAFSPRELASGLTGVTRYGIILGGAFFNWLEKNLDALLYLDGPAMAYCIRRCCELRAKVVAADERGTGLRALLNLGRAFDHAIKVEMGYGNWLHGEAVTAGMIMVARMLERLGQFSSTETRRTIILFTRAGLLVNGPRETSAQVYLPHMLRGKKVPAGEMHLILPLAIGKSEVCSSVSHELVPNAITDCQSA